MIFAFILSPFILLASFDFSLLRTHFWPYTDVVRKIRREVTRKDAEMRLLGAAFGADALLPLRIASTSSPLAARTGVEPVYQP